MKWYAHSCRLFFSVLIFTALVGCLSVSLAHEGENHGKHLSVQATSVFSGFWHHIREGVSGYTTASTVSTVSGKESGVLIQSSGQTWQAWRNGPVFIWGSVLLGASLLCIMIFHLWNGPMKLHLPRSGETVERWSVGERVLHWYTACLFLLLAITGISLLYGRALLLPLIGKELFATYAAFAKSCHDILGPVFLMGLCGMAVCWIRDNIPARHDLEWFASYLSRRQDVHPPAGRMNAGEKVWFWVLIIGGGIILGVSGVLLDFPNAGQERWVMQISHLLHVGMALFLIAISFGHAYIGSIGMEGTLEGMIKGKVDKTWVIQHHSLWAQRLTQGKK